MVIASQRRQRKDGGAFPERLSVATENYLSSLYKLQEEGFRTTPAQVADYIRRLPEAEGLGTTLPSVLGMLRRMAREDLVEVLASKDIELTKKGRDLAEVIVRRHRLAECMVVSLLGMELHEACVEGHRLEHAISQELEGHIQDKLGHPLVSPFGMPIPGANYVAPIGELVKLPEAPVGTPHRVDRIPDTDQELLRFLVEHGVVPGAQITVIEAGEYRGVLLFRTAEDEGALGYQAASRIGVHAS